MGTGKEARGLSRRRGGSLRGEGAPSEDEEGSRVPAPRAEADQPPRGLRPIAEGPQGPAGREGGLAPVSAQTPPRAAPAGRGVWVVGRPQGPPRPPGPPRPERPGMDAGRSRARPRADRRALRPPNAGAREPRGRAADHPGQRRRLQGRGRTSRLPDRSPRRLSRPRDRAEASGRSARAGVVASGSPEQARGGAAEQQESGPQAGTAGETWPWPGALGLGTPRSLGPRGVGACLPAGGRSSLRRRLRAGLVHGARPPRTHGSPRPASHVLTGRPHPLRPPRPAGGERQSSGWGSAGSGLALGRFIPKRLLTSPAKDGSPESEPSPKSGCAEVTVRGPE